MNPYKKTNQQHGNTMSFVTAMKAYHIFLKVPYNIIVIWYMNM